MLISHIINNINDSQLLLMSSIPLFASAALEKNSDLFVLFRATAQQCSQVVLTQQSGGSWVVCHIGRETIVIHGGFNEIS